MNSQIATIEKVCPLTELAAYVDGELSPVEELELEMHLAICKTCAAELNEQKKLLCALDFALENEKEIELPANFTKTVVAKAESGVSGLRCARERFNALFVCSTLFLFALFGFGAETKTVFAAFVKVGEQIFAVGGFIAHFVYDVSIGTAVILRSLSYLLISGSAASFAFFILFFFISLAAVSRFFIRYNQA